MRIYADVYPHLTYVGYSAIYLAHISDRHGIRIRMAIPSLNACLDKPAHLIIRMLFGFGSDSVSDKLNQSTNSETANDHAAYACQDGLQVGPFFLDIKNDVLAH